MGVNFIYLAHVGCDAQKRWVRYFVPITSPNKRKKKPMLEELGIAYNVNIQLHFNLVPSLFNDSFPKPFLQIPTCYTLLNSDLGAREGHKRKE